MINNITEIKPAINSIIYYYLIDNGYILGSSYFIPAAVVLFFIYYLNKKLGQFLEPYYKSGINIYSTFYFLINHSIQFIVLFAISLSVYNKINLILPVTEPVQSIRGLEQRIKVFDKLQHHIYMVQSDIKRNIDDRSRLRRHHINLQPVRYWHLSPVSSELDGLREYLEIVFTQYYQLYNDKKICNEYHKYLSSHNIELLQLESFKIVSLVSNYYKVLKSTDNKSLDKAKTTSDTVDLALLSDFKC